jgi:hypothetical protein
MNSEPVTITAQSQSADLGASKPIPAPERPKDRPIQHAVVIACGHKLDTRHFPVHSHCEDCWDAFFESNAQGLASVHQLLLANGTQAVTAVHGAKFTKAFGRYLRKQILKMHTEVSTQVKNVTGLEVPSLTEIVQGA